MASFDCNSRNSYNVNGCVDQSQDIDWESIGFGVKPTDYMYVSKCSEDENFIEGQLIPYGNIEMSPAAGVINYGQGLFEGMKAMRREDGKFILFRPIENAKRMEVGAQRMCMPAPSVDLFVDAVKQTALANKRWIPPAGKGSLYIRPLLLGTGPILGVSPSPEYTFIIYTSPVSNYFKEGSAPLNLYVEEEFHRASRGGAGGVKSITNYAPVLRPLTRAKSKGFSDVLYLDSVHKKYVEEVSACNVFMVKDNVISTPSTKGSILPGITRKSIVEIARDHGYQVEERLIEVEELLKADEVFCTGTAVVIVPVGSITYQGKRVEYKSDENKVYKQMLSSYMAIQNGEIEDKNNGDKNGYVDQNLDIDWENLGFGITPTDYMYVTKCLRDEEFSDGLLIPYGNIEMSPGAGVLNYGQGLYEGMKVMRREDGKIVMFRTNENAKRLQIGAQRMCMPAPSVDLFLDAVNQTALANKRWIPPAGKGCLYLRPLLLGTGPVLGLAPAPEYTFIIFASPVSNYFKEGSAPLNLYVEDEYHRASRGGTGGVKSITNYSPALKPLTRAKSRGYSDILYLDSVHKKYIEEVTACNVFIVKDNVISTPSTKGSILPGVTRKSIIEIARDHGYQVEERLIEVEELLEADEVFCTGTAVVVVPVGSVTYQGKRVEYKTDAKTTSKQLLSIYMGIQNGELEDKYGWMVEIN